MCVYVCVRKREKECVCVCVCVYVCNALTVISCYCICTHTHTQTPSHDIMYESRSRGGGMHTCTPCTRSGIKTLIRAHLSKAEY